MTQGTGTSRDTAPTADDAVGAAAPAFSIVMAAYDAADTIELAIRSALSQTMGDFELIVIDDGSKDATGAIIDRLAAEDPRIRAVHQENAGANATRNRALAMARGEHVTFLDTDDLKLPSYLERVHEAMSDPAVGLVWCDAYILDHANGRIHRSTILEAHGRTAEPPAGRDALLGQLIESCFLPFTATTVRRSVLEEAGPFDARLAGTDDWELWFRIVATGARAVRIPGVLAVMGRVEGQISGKRDVMLRDRRAMFAIVADELDVPDAVRVRAREMMTATDAEMSRPLPDPPGRLEGTLRDLAQRVTWMRHWRLRRPGEVATAYGRLRSPG